MQTTNQSSLVTNAIVLIVSLKKKRKENSEPKLHKKTPLKPHSYRSNI